MRPLITLCFHRCYAISTFPLGNHARTFKQFVQGHLVSPLAKADKLLEKTTLLHCDNLSHNFSVDSSNVLRLLF